MVRYVQKEKPGGSLSPAKVTGFACEYHRKYTEAVADIARLKAALDQVGGGNISLKVRARVSIYWSLIGATCLCVT